MRRWLPKSIYDAKPWALIGTGIVLCAVNMVLSVMDGSWTVTRSLLCLLGVALAVGGGITLQLRQDYRAKSKWRRDGS